MHLRRVAAADRLSGRISNLQATVQKFQTDSQSDCRELNIPISSVLAFAVDATKIDELKVASEEKGADLARLLDSDNTEGPVDAAARARTAIQDLRKNLDRPNQLYQQYLKELAEWEQQRRAILGAEDVPDTLAYYKKQVADLQQLPEMIDEAWRCCFDKAIAIYKRVQKLAEDYRKLYEPVQRFIERHPLAEKHFQLSFQTAIVEMGFSDGLLNHINQRKMGSFCGVSDGREKLAQICKEADFATDEGVRGFLRDIVRCLQFDTRQSEPVAIEVAGQLGRGRTVASLYRYILDLAYVRPLYTLRWGGKDISQLSPGERGTLLLVFYLLIDKSELPLIIDQPEENLDNQTVYDVLVPSIKEAKERRQIIVVTHNPNLAVVCDADQVVYAVLDKNDANRVTYTAGAIENPVINRRLVDILEGTRPAFDNRGAKYLPTA